MDEVGDDVGAPAEASIVGSSFTHLHTHTEFSMLDGAARVGEVIAKAVADGQPAIGITDHGNMYGVLDFYAESRRQGITPVVGSELYMAGESRHERPRRRGRIDDTGGDADGGQKLYYHLIALAENDIGYRNLIKLSSRAYLEGYFYKPRVDWELLEEHHDGIIATTGCLGGVVLQALLQGDTKAATERAARLQDIFGRDSLFVELQDHGLPDQQRTNPQLIEIARRIGAPLLATNDSHYTHQQDSVAHDALLCVQTGSTIDDPNRLKFHGDQHYLKTAEEMRRLFREVPEACDNTLWVAERADVTIEFGKPKLPQFPIPPEFLATLPAGPTAATGALTHDCNGLLVVEGPDDHPEAREEPDTAYLRHLTYEGARERWGRDLPATVTERLDYELGVIAQMGFSSYFIITWDLIKHARENGIRVGPGRGSAAGCAVAYCLWITDLDPIRYDLLFERFLNPSRVSMPDIDMDFDSRYRDEMIRYAAERYGRDHVAQIVTFSTIKARAAVRDAARVLGYPYVVGDKVAKAMPPLVMGRDTPLHACLEEHPKYADGFKAARELREMYEVDPDARKVIDVAKGLEGLRRQDGIHAAAVVITDETLTTYLPIQRKPEAGKDPEDAPVVTQYEMHGVEDLGLLKMDFLGLRNLDVISDTVELVRDVTGVELDIDDVPLDDDKTLAMLREGRSIGVFQLEGGPMRALMRSLAPTSFDDVAALVALYRPGPMAANMHNDYADRKNGRKPIEYLHPDAEEILADTQGLMIFQESVMRVAQKFAGYTLAEADNLRKACGKKIRELIVKERETFVAGCEATGYGREIGTAWFDIIEPFADYAFPKAHAYGYGLVAYQTAYLKAHHPVEFLAALLTSVKADQDKSAVYLNECRQMGIAVLVPDVNLSVSDFTARYGDDGIGVIPFGLSAVRNVGVGLVELVVTERDTNGSFIDFYDFCERVDPAVLNKRAIESLIKAGAFDALGHPRKGLLLVFDQIVERTLARRRERDQGVMSLFGDVGADESSSSFDERVAIPDDEFEKMERLAFEKEMLGLYVSDHPLMGAEHLLARRADCSITELREGGTGPVQVPQGEDRGRGGAFRTVGGVVTNLQRKYTKKGDLMAIFVLEDLQAAIEVMVFPKTMTTSGHALTEDAVVCVKGRLDTRDDVAKLIAHEISPVELIHDGGTPLRLSVPPAALDERKVDDLKRLLVEHPGDSPVFLHVGTKVLRLPPAFNVDTGNGLAGELRVLLGADALL
ncbi:MAG TPA: DNA polymerase III subunit alpha [Acidimicrobiales bacterium]|nr:DNA polymerase III subunit alpha [Acidimicrobiales bacterium]